MKVKNIIITVLFSLITVGFLILNIAIEDRDISLEERRKLTKLPEFTKENIFSSDLINNFESYAVDQIAFRKELRSLKSIVNVKLLGQKDDNKYFEKDGALYKIEYPINYSNLDKTTNLLKKVYDKYLKNMNVYYAIIPDKNFYLEDDHLKIDYDELKVLVDKKFTNIEYIDIWNELSLEAYYKTDIHWRQEHLEKVANKITTSMGNESLNSTYEKQSVGKFYGTYYGQIAAEVEADDMYILNNEITDSAVVYNYETNEVLGVYDTKNTNDKYDIYLSGATPLIGIKNQNVKNGKELLIFRDSFGSSLAPLLIEDYENIILIDLRYISSQILDKFVDFKDGQDVLFIYSTMLLNQNILK